MHNKLFENGTFNTFIMAVSKGDINTVDILLQKRPKFDLETTFKSQTALQIALNQHDLPMAAKLIHAGANTQVETTKYIQDDSWVGGYEEVEKKSIVNLNKYEFARLIDLIHQEQKRPEVSLAMVI